MPLTGAGADARGPAGTAVAQSGRGQDVGRTPPEHGRPRAPGREETLREVPAACLRAAGGGPGEEDLTWVGEDLLRPRLAGVEEESRPLWYPEDQIPQSAIDSSAALAAGLTFRPAEDTARDTLTWARAEAPGEGLDTPDAAERERALLDEWRRVAGGR